MRDEERTVWVQGLIERVVPEDESLDYKAALNTKTRSDKRELAKDISSFANERGGTVLYGVPEDDSGPAPVPRPVSECGLTLPPGAAETMENVLVETIDPPLSELCVRVVNLDTEASKQVLLVHHPASWNRPHMVLYEDRRYYRRGEFRAVKMREREVEAAYASRRLAATSAHEFLDSTQYGEFLPATFLSVAIAPHFSLVRRETMRERAFRKWLEQRPPAGRRGWWVPFLDGWRFGAYAKGPSGEPEFSVRLFHRGALAFTCRLSGVSVDIQGVGSRIGLHRLAQLFELYALVPALNAFSELGIEGPISLRVELGGVGTERLADFDPWVRSPHEDVPLLPNRIVFYEEATVSELRFTLGVVTERLLDHVAAAGGLWRRGTDE